MKIERFEDIEGWQQARQLTKAIYEITKTKDFARDRTEFKRVAPLSPLHFR